MVERRGKTLIITESKKGVSSWVRIGLNNVGLFMEGLQQCIEDVKGHRCGVEEIQYMYPEGQRDKGGWTAMVEALRQMDITFGKKVQQEEVRALGRSRPEMVKGRSFADTMKGWGNKGSNIIRVEVGWEELSRNISKLEHCLIGSWNPSNAKGEDLENWVGKMAKAWGLKGKMGIASMGKGRVLLEFELAEEARRVHLSGNKAMGGVQVDLERWNPRSGCMEEGEVRREVWVRILGLPISLWVPSMLRKVGDVCGGFLDVDPKTESMEDLQWARILIRSDGENIPGSLVIGVEGMTYSLSLWWEAVPSLRQEEGWKRGLWNRPRGEVSGDEVPRARSRVEEMACAGFEAQRQSEDGTSRLTQDVGSAAMGSQSQVGLLRGPGSYTGSAGPGQEMDWLLGPHYFQEVKLQRGIRSGRINLEARDGLQTLG
ncbi:hypothetical protein CK203_024828 [Vitis vinifera]|uniref:DUF4283 domain-containing protein n=1 Tax=Vitis vinifera TaxID=29760 RepID=A0A438IT41_VITVI|nr:hypothetical protein CK203_024828 [Vitis vinifera]